MGIKTRMIPEEYFELEVEDISKLRHSYRVDNLGNAPTKLLVHPVNFGQLMNEIMFRHNAPCMDDDNHYIFGMKIIRSEDIEIDKPEIV